MILSDAWIDLLAGWCSGAASVLTCQPVDTVLTRWQAGLLVQGSTVSSMARSLTQTAGVSALWRGSSPMITAVPMQNALLMSGYGLGMRYSELYAPDRRFTAIFVGGCTGGVLQSFLMSPVELIKISQQVKGVTLMDAGKNVFTNLYQPTAWRGLGATLLRDGIPHGVWFASYEMAKDSLREPLAGDPIRVPLLSGALAATVAWAVGYPADLIKTRIQAGSPHGMLGTARLLVQEANGQVLVGLYRGFGLKLMRSVPASMIGFTVYEFVKSRILDMRV
jgi:solute carrier family 25 (mitochondrial carnitine/acylcarnitine transporter), member 20/29